MFGWLERLCIDSIIINTGNLIGVTASIVVHSIMLRLVLRGVIVRRH